MKTILKISITLFFLSYHNIFSQQLVQTTNDLHILKDQNDLFRFRPLKNLVKEIKPDIKTAHIFNTSCTFAFCFQFSTKEQQNNNEGNSADNVTLLVYTAEPIPVNGKEDIKEYDFIWTSNHLQQYGDLRITRIDIVSNCPY